MLTERDIIWKWNDFSARPPENIAGFRRDLEQFCAEIMIGAPSGCGQGRRLMVDFMSRNV